MTEAHATAKSSNNEQSPFLNSRVYWRISAVALTAVALLGIALNATLGVGAWVGAESFLAFDWTHNILHVVLAGAAFAFGFGPVSEALADKMAVVFGVVYTGLAVLGFISGSLFGIGTMLGLSLEIGENLVHLLLGGWGLAVGLTK